jgi:hypothetical protein
MSALAYRNVSALRAGPSSTPADEDELPDSYIERATALLAAKHADEIEDRAWVLYLADQRELADADIGGAP